MEKYNLYVDGCLRPATGGRYFESINPSDGSIFAQVADGSLDDMRAAISAARNAFDSGKWSGLTFKERGRYLIKIAQAIREHAKELADLETLDVGKTTKQTTFIDVPTCADTFEYFGNVDGRFAEENNPIAAPVTSHIAHEPMGVVGCIIPWNYPLIMFGWKVAPALIMGNTVVFRPSSTASVSIMRLAEIINEVGLPKGVINIVSTSQHDVASELVKSNDVDMITFTGGTSTGKEVMCLASNTTKKLTMELGGKSPNIIFADCDLETAVGGAMSAIFMNQGQMCTAGSRLIVEAKIHDQILEQLIYKTEKLKIGPATNYDTDFGPVVSRKQRDTVLQYIKKGLAEGATLACGGNIPEDEIFKKGFYIEPTIFTNVTNSMTLAREEIFGPVLSVMKFNSIEEAIEIANDTPYGLAACVWTKDINKAERVSKKLKCGTVWVNTYGGFYNEAPFGGYKRSGFGRELGKDGLLEFTQTKHICVDKTPGGRPLVSSWF